MKAGRKLVCLLLIMIMLFPANFAWRVFAADNPAQPSPERFRIDENSTTPIGYNEYDKYYVDLAWDSLDSPDPVMPGLNKYINIYLQEITKPYKPSSPLEKKESNVSGTSTSLRMKNLNSGTIYYTYAKAYYTSTDGTTTYTSPESAPSNTVKFLTDIAIDAYSYGTKQIKIEWDDVWNTGRRIDYKLYISESKDFSNTPPIYINQAQIGPDGPVKVNEATGKLEYIHSVRDSGRVYYIKIAPDITDTELKKSPESKTLAVSSFILAKTTKLFTTDAGTIWRLDWSPVVTGLGQSDIKISYQIYKGNSQTGTIPQYMASVDDTTFFVTVQPGEEGNYFIIRAVVTKNGVDVYPGIKIESDKIYVREAEVPSYPPVPEIVDEFTDIDDVIISYEDELKPDSATVLWRAPKKASGEIDAATTYDIWLINDPNLIDNPPDNSILESSMEISDGNKVMSGTSILGYKYVITGLTPNSTYYFKIVAKKSYVDYVDGVLQNITYTSQPALKVIITPPEGEIDQPLVPGRPPLQVKKTPPPESSDLITDSTATIQIKNKWYEHFVDGNWEYITPEQLGDDKVKELEEGTNTDIDYRIVQYDSGVTIDVGCVIYENGMVYDDLKTMTADKITGVSIVPNDPWEDPDLNADGKKHNVDIELTQLDPNTTYVIWVRAVRLSAGLMSGPSDPLIITTHPVVDETVEKPTVPVFNYSDAADVYVDLGWNFMPDYNYYIKYGTEDNINTAKGSVAIKPEDLLYSSYYRIKELSPDTLYYFWIQAEAVSSSGQTQKSEWSDSYLVKTLAETPPATPRGFGVKTAEDAITKNSITYEWIMEDGMEYILEIASDIDYKDAKTFEVKSVSEYKVDGLRSNYRYFARLYAYDPKKDLKSTPTQSVTVRTERSSDDYDADQDIENVISGDYIVKDPVIIDGVWNIAITGVNADRFIEHVRSDSILDYKIDLSSPPDGVNKINILVSSRVFEALSGLKENIIIVTPNNWLVIRPGVLDPSVDNPSPNTQNEFNYEISIDLNGTPPAAKNDNVVLKTPATGINVNAYNGGNSTPVGAYSSPLKLIYTYTANDWYNSGVTSGYIFENNSSSWEKADTTAEFDTDRNKGYLSFQTSVPGFVAVGEPGDSYFDDISKHWAKSSIINVAAAHTLKSVEGREFKPDDFATISDAVKFMLDVLDYSYGADYMTKAVSAGIITAGDLKSPDGICTREKLITMTVRLYELKSGEKAVPPASTLNVFDDIGKVSPAALPKVKFAIENGIITSRFEDTLGPDDPVTRAEVMVILEKLLAFTGEIN